MPQTGTPDIQGRHQHYQLFKVTRSLLAGYKIAHPCVVESLMFPLCKQCHSNSRASTAMPRVTGVRKWKAD